MHTTVSVVLRLLKIIILFHDLILCPDVSIFLCSPLFVPHRSLDFWSQIAQVHVLASPFTSCITLDKLLNLCFLSYKMGLNLKLLLKGLSELNT